MDNINPFWLIAVSSIVAILPAIIGTFTSYLKVSIVLGALRNAFGLQQIPGAILSMSLSLGLTAFIMSPELKATYNFAQDFSIEVESIQTVEDVVTKVSPAFEPWISFLERNAGQREIQVLKDMNSERAKILDPEAEELEDDGTDISVLLSAFVLTELKEAFSLAFLVLLPFVIIDLIVANLLVGLGMYMVSPVMISLPLKILLFVVSDGWMLLCKGLITSYLGG